MKRIRTALACIAWPLMAAAEPVSHVLIISVDGMHAVDLERFSATHPDSAIRRLQANGVEFTSAYTPAPADSFPGLLALVTGGDAAATGVYYDVSYSRRLSPPGSACRIRGTVVAFDESVDDGREGIDPSRLPHDPDAGCRPVYPHDYLGVNTIFGVVKKSGGHTAWIDKHPVYEIVGGPGGGGLDDLYLPEIGANFEGRSDEKGKITASIGSAERYDAMKVDALLNMIDGKDHSGNLARPVPELFGINLQEVNVAQKIDGYLDREGTPSKSLEGALAHADRLIGKIVSGLAGRKLLESTLIVLTAKHGNGPIDPATLVHVDPDELGRTLESRYPGAIAQITRDRGALVWLRDRSKTRRIAAWYAENRVRLGIRRVIEGKALERRFPDDSRAPDLMLVSAPGVIYARPGDAKKAEHGGFEDDDTHVALLLSNPSLRAATVRVRVSTTQVAPTILVSLGIAPDRLDAVRKEGTRPLPGEAWAGLSGKP